MKNLSDESLFVSLTGLRDKARNHAIFITLIVCLVAFVFIYFSYKGSNHTRIEKQLKRQNDSLRIQISQLRTKFTIDSIERVQVANQISIVRAEADQLRQRIANASSELNKYQKKYEKVPNYRNIPANDSLLRIYKSVFDY